MSKRGIPDTLDRTVASLSVVDFKLAYVRRVSHRRGCGDGMEFRGVGVRVEVRER